MSMPSDRDLTSRMDETHRAHLALCKTQKERVRYSCEVLARPRPESADVLDFLELYGYIHNRRNQTANVRNLVSKWRSEHGMADTGNTPPMTPEMLDLIDQRAAASKTVEDHPRPSLSVVHRDTGLPVDGEHPSGREVEFLTAFRDELGGDQVREPDANPVLEVREPAPVSEQPAPAPAVSPGSSAADRLNVLGRRGAYGVAAVALGVSADTSLQFFKEVLQVEAPVRFFLFGVMELALVVCAVLMAAGVRSERGTPGPARLIAWGLCGFAVFAAMDMSGPLNGPLRAALGPILSMVMLHLALGLEWRNSHGSSESVGMLARLVAEWRDRILSRVGMVDDRERGAAERARARASSRFATLTEGRFVIARKPRLRRLSRIAGLAHDPEMLARTRAEHAVLQNVLGLREVQHESVWK